MTREDGRTAVYLLASCAAMFVLAALASVAPQRTDHLIYGR